MKYVFDIDGTLCTQSAPHYEDAVPFIDRIKKVNSLYEEGHIITLFTARGMGRHNNNQMYAVQDFYELTARQMKRWGVRYHFLILGKPNADIYVDDKGVKDAEFFRNEIRS